MNIKELVKNQNAHFVFFRDQALYYETDNGFQFPVPVGDAGSATFNHEEKAILLMRYIRKHVEKTAAARRDQDNGLVCGSPPDPGTRPGAEPVLFEDVRVAPGDGHVGCLETRQQITLGDQSIGSGLVLREIIGE